MKNNCNSLISPDKRGKHVPSTKLTEETLSKVTEFLDSIPKYRSHYCTNNKLYFHPQASQQKLFSYFKELNPNTKISIFKFSEIFKKYNVKIYVPKKDTCARCDEFNSKLKSVASASEIEQINEAKIKHQRDAELARQKLRDAEQKAINNDKVLCITFDLEKVHPLPYMNTSVAFYKRQLNFYNFGINDRKGNKGFMYTWTETSGKRGSNEILSCLLAFLTSRDLSNIDEIISFSDSCGGQNKNKNIIQFINHVCKIHNIDWCHTYLESGHSYLPNDTDFGKIEKKLKTYEWIFSEEQWINLIKKCNFNHTDMKNKFFDFSSKFTSIKKTTTNTKFQFLQLKEFRLNRTDELMSFKTSHSPDAQIQFVELNDDVNLEFEKLYQPHGIKLSRKKYDDIMYLMRFLPTAYIEEYRCLPHESDGESVADVQDFEYL